MATPRWQYLLLFLAFLSASLAASPTSFCKCTCFNSNSTIIALDDTSTSPSLGSNNSTPHTGTCNDCNKKFCLDSSLAICAEATEADVSTTCFQRDSVKDETIIFIFIFATLGLLVWAAIKPYALKWRDNRRVRYSYVPVGDEAADGQ